MSTCRKCGRGLSVSFNHVCSTVGKQDESRLTDLATYGKSLMLDGKLIAPEDFYIETIQISPELRDRIVEALGFARFNAVILFQDSVGFGNTPTVQYQKEIAEIDSILKELAVK